MSSYVSDVRRSFIIMDDPPQKAHRARHSGVKAEKKKEKGIGKQLGHNEKASYISISRCHINFGPGFCTKIRTACGQASAKEYRARPDSAACSLS